MANEPFDIKKWFGGFLNPVTWSKSVVYLAMGLVILVIIFTVYRAYFMKTGSNINKPIVVGLPGSTIGNVTFQSEQKIENKRKFWQPIPYVAVFGEYKSVDASINHFEAGYGITGGIRWDF